MRFLFWFFLIFLVVIRFITTRPTYREGQKIRITTTISSDPIKYSDRQTFSAAGLKISLPLYPEINYGDKVVIEGEVDDTKFKKAKLIKAERGAGLFPNLRKNLINFYQNYLPEPHASLVSGTVLGAKSSLPGDFWSALKKTGTAHVVVASGMNVTMVSGFLIGFLALILPRKRAIPLALVGILAYVLISGFDAPIIRAAVMGSLTFLAQELGRVVSAWRILAFSALMMLIVRPDWIGDIGFILSFAATGSLVLFERRTRGFLDKKRAFGVLPNFLKSDFSTTLAAQVGVAPILFVTFGQFNPLSPIINALVLWTVPLIMIIGASAGILGLIIPSLGKLVLYLLYPLTTWFVWVIQLFS